MTQWKPIIYFDIHRRSNGSVNASSRSVTSLLNTGAFCRPHIPCSSTTVTGVSSDWISHRWVNLGVKSGLFGWWQCTLPACLACPPAHCTCSSSLLAGYLVPREHHPLLNQKTVRGWASQPAMAVCEVHAHQPRPSPCIMPAILPEDGTGWTGPSSHHTPYHNHDV